MIIIKDEETLEGLLFAYHPTLVKIVLFVFAYEGKICITCGYREGDIGVHGTVPCRGIDLRSWIYPNPQDIVDRVNSKWIYDPDRPDMKCAVLHATKSGALHIHLQVHPNTEVIA